MVFVKFPNMKLEKEFSNAFKLKQLFFFTNFSTILNKSNNIYNMSTIKVHKV